MTDKLKLDHISYSQVDKSSCLRFYKDVYKLKKYDTVTGNVDLIEGRFVHDVLDHYVQYVIKHGHADEEACREIFDDFFKKYVDDGLPLANYDVMLEKILMFGELLDVDRVLESERKFKIAFPIKGNEDLQIWGVFDRIDFGETEDGEKVVRIIEYKNFHSIPPKEDEKLKTLQMKIYLKAATELFGNFQYFQRVFVFTRYSWRDEHGQPHLCQRYVDKKPLSISDAMVEVRETESLLKIAAERMNEACESGEFKETAGQHCFKYGGCPIMIDGKCSIKCHKETVSTKPMEQAKSFVHEIDYLTARVNDLKKQAKEIVKANGGQLTMEDGRVVGDIPKQSVTIPLPDFQSFLSMFDVDDDTLEKITFSNTAVTRPMKKWCKDNNVEWSVIDDHLDSCRVVKDSVTFKF